MGRGLAAFLFVLTCWACPVGFSVAEEVRAAIDGLPATTEQQPAVRDETRPYTLTVGIREWISQGRSAHNIGAPDGHPNVLSELSWRGMNSVITEVNADLVVKHFVVMGSIGYGTIGGGTLRDQDWDGDNRTQKAFETLSRSNDGSVLIISLTPGVRAFQWTAEENPVLGGIDILLGYQYWREQYVGFGAVNQLGPGQAPDVKSITQTNTWQSLRLGTRITVPLLSRIALKGSAFYIPVTAYRNEDIHHLRTGGSGALRQNPSFLTTASGGRGVQLEGSLSVRVWRQLTLEAGYAYWDIRSGSGIVEAYPASGGVVQESHNVENTRRQGVFFGVNWIF
jgi:hypothetical protein